ncbi:MAG: ATP-binding protein [Candidatus Eisenbacteria bacterium]|nr:ATP-binding protein [Candidatus Eisenbacteria bacterium]
MARSVDARQPSRRHRVASIVHYEQAFFIRQIIAASVPAVSLVVRHSFPNLMFAFYVVIAVTCLNLFYYWLTVTGRFRSSFKWVQIGIDMFLWTLLIHVTGGKDSVFFFLYPLEILVAAFTLSASGCAYGATLAGVFYTIDVGFLGSHADLGGTHIVRLFFLSAIAAISVLVVRKLEKKTVEVERLSEMLRERAESAETSLGAVLDTVGDGLLILDEKGGLLSVNGPFARMCEIADGRLPGEAARGTPFYNVKARLLELLSGGAEDETVEITFPQESGRPRGFHLKTKVFKRHGERCIMAIASDGVLESERNDALFHNGDAGETDSLPGVGETALVIAHEVRNSLTCIMGLLSLLNEDLSGKAESVGLLRKAVGAAEDLNLFVSDLLVYSQRVEPRLEKTDLVSLLNSVIELVSGKLDGTKNVRLTREFSVSRLEAEVDPRYMQRVIINLFLNAYQAVNEEGSVCILLREEDGNAVIEVKDDGCGISSEHIDKIFEPFFTAKGKGSGLGLAIAKRLVEAHRGNISAISNPEVGSTLTVRVPAARHDAEVRERTNELLCETTKV